MKRLVATTGLWLLFLATAVFADEPLNVPYGQTVTLTRSGVTAAYAIDAGVADATASEGTVHIRGIGAGRTIVVMIAGDATESVSVVVSPPPAVYPPGFTSSDVLRGPAGGMFESRYSSNPRQVLNSIDLRREEGKNVQQLRVYLANYLDASYGERFGFPQILYRLANERREIAIGDTLVASSPLTIGNSQLRGLHLQQGDWTFHGGISSASSYQGAILATAAERAFGVTRRFHLSNGSEVSGNLYHFGRSPDAAVQTTTGFLGSVLYSRRTPGKELESEVAVARRAFGVGFRYNYAGERDHLLIDVRRRPYGLPALSTEAQQGTFAEINFGAALSARLNAAGSVVGSEYDIPSMTARNFAATERLIYALRPGWTSSFGASASRFSSSRRDSPIAKKAMLPIGIGYTRPLFGASAEYEPTWDMDGRRADGFHANAALSVKSFHANVYYRHDVDLPTLQSFFAVSEIYDLLQRAGLLVTDVNQMISYLRDSAFLVKLGLASNIQFNVAPARDDVGMNLEWSREGQRVSFSGSDANTQLVTGNLRMRTATLMYTLQLTAKSEVSASASAVQIVDGGSSSEPVVTLAYRRRLETVPSLAPQRPGRIWGHVFRDDQAKGVYDLQQVPLADVQVKLDDGRSVRTRADGFYEFDRVRPGTHVVSAIVTSERPYAFTTDSPRKATINTAVDFGVTFLLGRVIGRVANDAGGGVDGVLVTLQSVSGTRDSRTNAEGQFTFANLPDGYFWLATSPDSYPPGYELGDLAEDPIVVRNGEPVTVTVFARALRSISGTVVRQRISDVTPEVGIEVRIPQLNRTTRTNASGRYHFFDLPAGNYTVALSDQGTELTKPAVLPPEPAAVSANFTLPIAASKRP